MLDRRSFLVTGAGLAAMSLAPRMAFAKAETDRRFVFIIQRGAADGLGTIGAVGDPAFAGARGVLGEDFATGKKLDSLFALHPAMPSLGGMYDGGEVLFAHAIASPYRDRSHFDGQNVLESGGTGFGRTVAVNGTGGSDHGTGSAAMLVGGAVKGGRVMADWPGLGQAALYEGRDLKPTLGLDQFVAGAVAGHYGVEPGRVMAALFPETKGAMPVIGISRA